MTCPEVRRILRDSMPGDLTRGTRAAVHWHLRICVECQEYMVALNIIECSGCLAARMARDLADQEYRDVVYPELAESI